MAKHLPENLESSPTPPQRSEAVLSRQGTSLGNKLDETLEIFDELRGKYALFSDFLQESNDIARKQAELARELNDEIDRRRLFIKGERIEIGGQTSTVRSTANPDFYSIAKNLASKAFFEGRFRAAHVVPVPDTEHYLAMGNAKHEYAEWTSNRYGLTFMFDQTVVVIPSDDYPFSSDSVEVFQRPYTLIPVEYPGVDLRSADIAREKVMELFNGTNRADWAYRGDLAAPVDRIDEGKRGL